MICISTALHLKANVALRKKLLANDAIAAHAAVLHKITEHDPALGESLHIAHQQRNMTLSIPRSDLHSATLRVAFFGQNSLTCMEVLMNQLLQAR